SRPRSQRDFHSGGVRPPSPGGRNERREITGRIHRYDSYRLVDDLPGNFAVERTPTRQILTSWRSMVCPVLVTGGAGFIGSHLVRMLVERGEKVRVLERPGANVSHLPLTQIDIVWADIRDRAA